MNIMCGVMISIGLGLVFTGLIGHLIIFKNKSSYSIPDKSIEFDKQDYFSEPIQPPMFSFNKETASFNGAPGIFHEVIVDGKTVYLGTPKDEFIVKIPR